MDMKIHRAAACAAKIGVHKNTVKAWSLKGKRPAGHRHGTDASVERVSEAGRTVVHGCVSRRVQGDDLRRNRRRWRRSAWGRVWRWTSG